MTENTGKREKKCPKYTTVLLDADNTLFDFDAAEDQALRRTLEARGVPYSASLKAHYLAINRPLWDALHRGEVTQDWLVVERFRRFGAYCGVEADPVAWDAEYLDLLGECATLLPGALELLQSIKPYCRLGLATNGITHVQKKRLAASPIRDYFDGIFISQEMGVGKPDPAYFHRILDTFQAKREETVMIGDNLLSDIQGAVNAGLDSIWLSPKGEGSGLPTYIVKTLPEIQRIVLGEEK